MAYATPPISGLLGHTELVAGTWISTPPFGHGALTLRRRWAGASFAVVALVLLTVVTTGLRAQLAFAADVPLYLFIVVTTSLIGGFVPAVASAVAASLLLNYYFTQPRHSLAIRDASNVIALVTFLVIALLVSRVVHVAAHRSTVVAAAQPLVESGRQRATLLNAVSHDLRTPIAAAKAAVASLRSTDVTWSEADRNELLGTAETALDRLSGLVTNLLDLSRLQAGAMPVASAVVGLDDVVSRALDYVDPGVRVDVAIPPELTEVVADAGLLERVVANLLQNALRYAPPATTVSVTASRNGAQIELRIVDHGPGFPVDTVDEAFRPFQRTNDAPTDGGGVGLGLAISRGFAEAMDGDVRVEQTAGGGATVVVSLRAAPPAGSGHLTGERP